MTSGRYFRGALGELQGLFDEASKLVINRGRATIPFNEHMTAGHGRMLPEDLARVAGSSGEQNQIANESIPDVHRIMRAGPGVWPDVTGANVDEHRLWRQPGEPFFTVHNHPGGWVSPSRGDLGFQHVHPGTPDHLLGVVAHSGQGMGESSMNPLDPLGSTVVMASSHDPADSLFRDKTLPYLHKYIDDAHVAAAALDPNVLGLVRSAMPFGTKSADVDQATRKLLGRVGYLPPLMRLSEPDRGVYDTLYDVGNMMTPVPGVDQNDLLEQLYATMKRRGHLDYQEGGLV